MRFSKCFWAGAMLISAGAFNACTSATTSSSVVAPSASKCSVTIATTPSSFTAGGGSGTVTVSTERDCTWSVGADASWVSFTGAHDGQGASTVPFTVAANPVPTARSSSISAGSDKTQLSQAGAPCTFSLSRSHDDVGASGGQVSVGISTLSGCSWSASSNASWLSIVSGQSGNASGTIVMSVAPNSGVSRVGTVNAGGQSYTVAEDAAAPPPPPTPPPSSSPPPPSPDPSPSPTPTPPPPPPPPPPSGGSSVEVDGQVQAVLGGCPNIQFFVDGTLVAADQSTKYGKDSHCPDVKPGVTVSVSGTTQPTGIVDAATITVKKDKG